MRPAYLRLYAATDGTATGRVAFEYCKALLRIMPVRVLGAGAVPGFDGPWRGYERLMTTPANGPFINLVATPSDRWTWMHRISMPNKDGSVDTAEERVELWTMGVRNVLLAAEPPKNIHEVATAKKYDAVIVPSAELASTWERTTEITPFVISVPLVDTARNTPITRFEIFRTAVLGYLIDN